MFVCFPPQGYNAMSMDIPDKLTNHFNFFSEEHGHFAWKGHLLDSLKCNIDDEVIF